MSRLLLNQISLAVATLFFIFAAYTKNFWLIGIGLVMVVYSNIRIKMLKDGSNGEK